VSTVLNNVKYVITVVPDGVQACAQTASVDVTVLRGFDLLNTDETICPGESVVMNITGNNRYQYTWLPSAGISGTMPSVTATPDVTTTYTLKASYPGCLDSLQTVTITVEPVPSISLGSDTALCYGDELYMSPLIDPFDAQYQYKWEPAGAFSNPAIANPLFIASDSTTASFTITTPTGCTSKAERAIKVYSKPKVEAGPDVRITAGKTDRLQGRLDGDAPVSLRWTPATWLSGDRILNPLVTPQHTQLYYLTATGAGGCKGYDSVLVKVFTEIHVPNAFTPNGDGINDKWVISGLSDFRQATVEIFNRWGQVIYRSTGYNTPWDGTFRGAPLQMGAYYYIIQPKESGYGKLSGAVMLIR
jgi:gliding motility-associated-like protein